jgi:hypothetical protein
VGFEHVLIAVTERKGLTDLQSFGYPTQNVVTIMTELH